MIHSLKPLLLRLAAFLLLAPMAAAAPLKVVTTVPDLAEFVTFIGGDKVSVSSLTSGREDPHNILLRPSMITRVARADLFVLNGLDLEHAYAPQLLAEARNRKLQPGGSGYLDCSRKIRPLDIPERPDRAGGDVHAYGNPHYNTDPLRMKIVAGEIGGRLAELDPANAAFYQANAKALAAKLDAKTAEWKRKLSGRKIRFVSYHPVWSYFAERFGVEPVGSIQPRPGIEPGPRYLRELIERMKAQDVRLIVKENYFGDGLPRQLAQATGAKVVTVPTQVNATPEASDYFAFIDALVDAFAKAP